jgi:hypothetical protein
MSVRVADPEHGEPMRNSHQQRKPLKAEILCPDGVFVQSPQPA